MGENLVCRATRKGHSNAAPLWGGGRRGPGATKENKHRKSATALDSPGEILILISSGWYFYREGRDGFHSGWQAEREDWFFEDQSCTIMVQTSAAGNPVRGGGAGNRSFLCHAVG